MKIRTPYVITLPLHIHITTNIPCTVERAFTHNPMVKKVEILDKFQMPESNMYVIDLEVDVFYSEIKNFMDFIETCNHKSIDQTP